MKTGIICEGAVRLKIPDDVSTFSPSAAAVFYNPEMELNRDITVAAISGFIRLNGNEPAKLSYADVMSASGIRGIRMASEVGVRCRLNDWSQDAFELIQDNITLNRLDSCCSASCQNANTLLHQKRFDIVDVDPFGSPAPYLDSAARSARMLLCITATDTAPLCGAHLKSGIRKYAAVPLNTEYHREMGARILLGAAARALARCDKGMKVLLTHATRHYVRTYLEIIRGTASADMIMEEIGFISHCFNCGYRSWKNGLVPEIIKDCPNCTEKLRFAGPLWLGTIQDAEFCQKVLYELEERKSGKWKQASKIITFCKDEINIPAFYDHHWLCKKKKISPCPIDELIGALKDAGFEASGTHFSGTGFKTNAGIAQINSMLKNM
jgi:tRNA (guanine26-N2/guanine27-N2)-dimethyltransferase